MPLLLKVLNESAERGSQATISLIHKKGKDPLETASYRPVSLLNVDTKILAKVLTTRLEHVLPTIIQEDQTGFIKNRQMTHNIRRLFNIIYPSNPNSPSVILISMDAGRPLTGSSGVSSSWPCQGLVSVQGLCHGLDYCMHLRWPQFRQIRSDLSIIN